MVIESKLKLTEKDVSSLKESDYNPRKIKLKNFLALEQSLKKFGLVQPLIVNKKNNVVISGNQRLKILKKNGVKKVKVIEVELNESQEKALNITLNSDTLTGSFTTETNNILNELKLNETSLYDSLNLKDLKIEEVLKESEEQEEFDPVPEMEIQPYEHYDYVLIVCKDMRDWFKLIDLFDLKKVNASTVGKKKIGLGRVITFEKFMEKISKVKK